MTKQDIINYFENEVLWRKQSIAHISPGAPLYSRINERIAYIEKMIDFLKQSS